MQLWSDPTPGDLGRRVCCKTRNWVGQLRSLGVLGNKHIPPLYLRASTAQRRRLLSGLLDTDGTVAPNGGVQYTTTVARLAQDVHELACSLGYRATTCEGRARLDGRDCGPKWTIGFTTHEEVFGLERKQLAHRSRRRADTAARTSVRYVVDVRPVPSVPVRCIQVASPTGMYLAGRTFIATHNSQIARAIAYKLWLDRGRKVETRNGEPFYGYLELQPGPSADDEYFRYAYVPDNNRAMVGGHVSRSRPRGSRYTILGGEQLSGTVSLVLSQFVEAMENGWMVMLDEVNVAREVALLSINGTLDGRLILHLPALGRTVKAQPGFGVVLGYNPQLLGATDLPQAWRSRFPGTLEVTSNWAALVALGVPEKLVRAARALDARRFKAEDGFVWTPQFRDIEDLDVMMRRLDDERLAIAFFMSNIHERVAAGEVQAGEAAAVATMLDEAGYAHLHVPGDSEFPHLGGYARAVTAR